MLDLQDLFYITDGIVSQYTDFWRELNIFLKLNIHLVYNPAIPL